MSKELPDHGGSSWAYLFHDAAHRKRLALPRLWPRERADDGDLSVQAVAEDGGDVMREKKIHKRIRSIAFCKWIYMTKEGWDIHGFKTSDAWKNVTCKTCLRMRKP